VEWEEKKFEKVDAFLLEWCSAADVTPDEEKEAGIDADC
jgi:hypothetical protein